MPSVLVTAFEPYDSWSENSSWLTLIEFTKQLDARARITTRLYPVDFVQVRERLTTDLAANYDCALHLGQAPGSTEIRLESIGLNLRGDASGKGGLEPLVPDGPLAYRSSLPLGEWAETLRSAGIPARVSYHAGTYLCNATLYLSHHLAAHLRARTQTTFVHLPLDPCQAVQDTETLPSLPASLGAGALRLLVAELIKRASLLDPGLA